jgi:hypothetical protein
VGYSAIGSASCYSARSDYTWLSHRENEKVNRFRYDCTGGDRELAVRIGPRRRLQEDGRDRATIDLQLFGSASLLQKVPHIVPAEATAQV